MEESCRIAILKQSKKDTNKHSTMIYLSLYTVIILVAIKLVLMSESFCDSSSDKNFLPPKIVPGIKAHVS